jgi:hypothetical protein
MVQQIDLGLQNARINTQPGSAIVERAHKPAPDVRKSIGLSSLAPQAMLGKSQVRFGKWLPKDYVINYLNTAKFKNDHDKEYTLGQLFSHLAAKAEDCDGEEGPVEGTAPQLSHRYAYELAKSFSFNDRYQQSDILSSLVVHNLLALQIQGSMNNDK